MKALIGELGGRSKEVGIHPRLGAVRKGLLFSVSAPHSFYVVGALIGSLDIVLEQISSESFLYALCDLLCKVGRMPRDNFDTNTLNYTKAEDLTSSFFFFCPSYVLPSLSPVSEPCLLPLDQGQCKNTVKQWYFNIKQRICKPFFYGGCLGNANNFPKKEDCMKACSSVVKDGQCPLFPFKNRMECSASCKSDYDCPLNEKCCESMCGFDCAMAWTVKAGFCPNKPPICSMIDRPKPKCLQDNDCPLTTKCCSRCGLKCLEPLK
uniref:WAP four-disulfide core domain 8 n=1 Tax=Capra hircus TaxID=9925 RepID=A0A8C2RCG4_CAPHI